MSKPNFVTRTMIEDMKVNRVNEAKKEKAHKFRAGLNEWWQNSALPTLTHLGCFSDDGLCEVEVGIPLAELYGIGEFAIAVNEKVLSTGAPYTVQPLTGTNVTKGYWIRFTCV